MKKQLFDFDAESNGLTESWAAVEQRLRSAEMVAPRRGFTGRWLARVSSEPEVVYQPRQQDWALLAASGLLTLLLFVVLLEALMPLNVQPGSIFASLVRTLSLLVVTSRVLVTSISAILSEIPLLVWLFLSTSAMAGLLLAALGLERLKINKEIN